MNELINWPAPGRYILAVSGGADSMVLLDLFAAAAAGRGYELTVAHFDHGIRADSAADADFVKAAAARLGLEFESHSAELGPASEATARTSRHYWLEKVRRDRRANAVITAHHQDDLLETSLLNLARGSGRMGLAPMSETSEMRRGARRGRTSRPAILRPLLGVSRARLREYAAARQVQWREDPTNADLTNPRNFLRHRLLTAATTEWRARYLELVSRLTLLNTEINHTVRSAVQAAQVDAHTYSFPTPQIQDLTDRELQELIVATARALVPGVALDRRLVEPAAAFARNGRSGGHLPLRQNILLVLKKGTLAITTNANP